MQIFNIHKIGLITLFALLGLAGNLISLPLLYGIHFIFGSIAVLLAARLTGTPGALISAVVASSRTYFLWGHPYAVIIFTLEGLVVSLLLKRNIKSLTLADLIYWLFIGMPLVWLFYNDVMGMGTVPSTLIMLKQSVNGIANAIVATYLLLLLPVGWRKVTQHISENIGLREVLFTTLLAFSLAPTLLIIGYQSYDAKKEYEANLALELSHYSGYLAHKISANQDPANAHNLLQDYAISSHKYDILLLDKNRVITSSLPEQTTSLFLNDGTRSQVTSGLYSWLPAQNGTPSMIWRKQAYYYVQQSFNNKPFTDIYLLHRSSTIINRLEENTLSALYTLFILIIISGLISLLMSKALTSTLIKLTNLTRNLPSKLKQGEQVNWPASRIQEVNQLSSQSKQMADSISDTLSDINTQARSIIESSVDSIVTIDEMGIIETFNSAAENQFGYTRDEVIGQNVKVLMPQPYHDEHDGYLERYKEGSSAVAIGRRREVTGKRKDGSVFPMELSVTEIQLQNKRIFAGIISDITARKVSEKLKQEFISTVSHELRTPLTSIKGSIKLVHNRLDVASRDETESLLEVTSRNVDRLSTLINDLLDFEKLESGGISYDQQVLEIRKLVTDAIIENTPLAKQAEIELQPEINTRTFIQGDAMRINQVLSNFISNAIKFSEASSTVLVGCAESDGVAKIYVKDYGPGIPDEFKSHIFERFTQADANDNRMIQRGTGLGLAIAKKMTEDMNGNIGFESTLGEGSVFYITFPVIDS